MDLPNYLTVKQFLHKHEAFTNGGIRDRIFNAATNGLDKYKVVLRDGRRVLINEANFFNWLLSEESKL